ncbi:MAG: choline dehydrogenase [Myxococcales bacterium]|nr:MAG: choline dehydrogenase [Myxococcales bacterium]
MVGAGAAGAVIAARVSEREDREVLLIEAGPDYGALGPLPGDLDDGTRNSFRAHDWGYRHRPTTQMVALPLPRGKVVGGSSAVNTCIALRGVPSDYDEWASLGLPDWTWEKCLPAFKRLETDLDIRNEWHGQTGPVPLRRHTPEELTPWHASFLEACDLVGHPRTNDHNDPDAEGAGPHAMNKLEGRRMSAARCYLDWRTRARRNLTIMDRTTVRRVLFEGRRAVGVEVEREGVVSRIEAKKVVLCGGAIATPGVLLRSGIGGREDLARIGVEQVADVPAVGAHLLDHPGAAFFLLPKPGVVDLTGPLIQTALRLRSPGSEHKNDVQIQSGSGLHLPGRSARFVILMVQVGKPRGVGRIRYDSADPHARPVIDSRLLEDRDDRQHAVRSLRLALELAEQKPMRDIARPVWPPPPVLRRVDWLEAFIRRVSDSGYHPSGTVPMGKDGDPAAATDGRGRVRGVENLVVADASIMPTIPTANTHIPTLMIGERVAEWLRDGDV